MKLVLTALAWLMLTVASAPGLERTLGLKYDEPALREKPVVMLYFGNDRLAPVDDDGITRFISYLRSGLNGKQYLHYRIRKHAFSDEDLASYQQLPAADKAFLSALADFSSHDSSEDGTRTEVRAIQENLARKNPRYAAGFMIFRNFANVAPLNRKWKWSIEHSPPGSDKESRLLHDVPNDEFPAGAFEFPYAEQGLSHPAVFARMLKCAEELYPPDQHRYLVVIKSQGGGELAVAPRYDVDLPAAGNYVKLLTHLLKHKDELLQGREALPPQRGTNARLSRIAAEFVGRQDRAGITAAEVIRILAQSKGNFPLVFFDVNELKLPAELRAANIGSVFYTDQPVPYEWLDYDDLFSYVGVTTKDLEVRLREFLRAKVR